MSKEFPETQLPSQLCQYRAPGLHLLRQQQRRVRSAAKAAAGCLPVCLENVDEVFHGLYADLQPVFLFGEETNDNSRAQTQNKAFLTVPDKGT